jgi:hypothetical protein
MLTGGVWAEIKIGAEHLRLFSEINAQGVQASVYNVVRKMWVAPSQSVEDIEHGKEWAAGVATEHLKQAGHSELPTLIWKEARSR